MSNAMTKQPIDLLLHLAVGRLDFFKRQCIFTVSELASLLGDFSNAQFLQVGRQQLLAEQLVELTAGP